MNDIVNYIGFQTILTIAEIFRQCFITSVLWMLFMTGVDAVRGLPNDKKANELIDNMYSKNQYFYEKDAVISIDTDILFISTGRLRKFASPFYKYQIVYDERDNKRLPVFSWGKTSKRIDDIFHTAPTKSVFMKKYMKTQANDLANHIKEQIKKGGIDDVDFTISPFDPSNPR